MSAVAGGLAKEGKKVFTYAIAPFITSRCHEFTKLNCGLMKIPINLVGVGPGFSYDDSGPTHHLTEDISIMRAIPNLEIYCPSDNLIAKRLAKKMYCSENPAYIRLDREILPNLSDQNGISKNREKIQAGFREFGKGDLAIVSTGNMVHTALEVQKYYSDKNIPIGVLDLHQLKPISEEFKKNMSGYKNLVSLEEHLLDGGLGSIIAETIIDNNLLVNLKKRIGLVDYVYAYGGRKNIQELYKIDEKSVINEIDKLIN
jgi:transketolase